MATTDAERVIALYHENAALWGELRGRELIERDWLGRFLAALPEGGRRVLDLGCGPGVPIAAHLIAEGCELTGVDGAAGQIEAARAHFPAERWPGHRWLVADMRALPELGRFHGVIAWHSFFHLTPEDQRPMFATFARLALPGAALMFTSGPRLGEAIGSFAGQPLYHGSLDSAEYRALLAEAGFEVLRHVEEDAECGGATVWLARRLGA